MNRLIRSLSIVLATLVVVGCTSPASYAPYDYVRPYRTPTEMEGEFAGLPRPAVPQAHAPILTDRSSGDRPEIPLRRPLPDPEKVESDSPPSEPSVSKIIENARDGATQHPSEKRFINAVQVYEFVPGAIYEVITTPGFVTMLYLKPGEELKHLAAGDTTRWLIDVVSAGDNDAQADGDSRSDAPHSAGRVSILIKPRFPALQTNLVVATNERIYLIDLKSHVETYHSAVEWTYPKSPVVFRSDKVSRKQQPPVRGSAIRNYLYTLKAPPNGLPSWAPRSVYDDGHRVYVEFDPSIHDLERPPLYLLDPDGIAQMVNYRTESNYYVVDRLFDRAALRIGSERVVIERVRPRPISYAHYPRINYTRK